MSCHHNSYIGVGRFRIFFFLGGEGGRGGQGLEYFGAKGVGGGKARGQIPSMYMTSY